MPLEASYRFSASCAGLPPVHRVRQDMRYNQKIGASIMDPLIIKHRRALEDLCAEFRVRRLELFGSAAKVDLEGAANDLDFLVEFEETGPRDYAKLYFGLLDALTALFHKHVDLVATSAVTNPYFLEGIQPTRTLLYAA